MYTRFLTAVTGTVAGGFIAIASFAFAIATAAWITFGIGLGLMAVSAVPALFGERRLIGLALDGLSALLAIWTVVASVVFSGNVVKWLSFSEGVAFVTLALGALVLNQVRLTRPSHVAVPSQIGSTEDAEHARRGAVAA
jgi:hypothetical protein